MRNSGNADSVSEIVLGKIKYCKYLFINRKKTVKSSVFFQIWKNTTFTKRFDNGSFNQKTT